MCIYSDNTISNNEIDNKLPKDGRKTQIRLRSEGSIDEKEILTHWQAELNLTGPILFLVH